MTLGQLSAFVLVARLGSVTAAARALGVSEPAVSQALGALRQHHDDKLLVRTREGMTLTAGGRRLLPIASQMVSLGADAEAAVREAKGVAEELRVVVASTIAEFVANPLLEAFGRKSGGPVDFSAGLAKTAEMPVLVGNRLADAALGPRLDDADLDSVPIFRGTLVAVGSPRRDRAGSPSTWPWLVDPSGTDEKSDTAVLLRKLAIPDERVRVFANQTAAWSAAASGLGVSVAVEHLVAPQLRRRELVVVPTRATPMPVYWHVTTASRDRCSVVASSLRHFLGTPVAMQIMRSPGSGVPPSRFRPPVFVTIWS
ncbi:LysR family transcriptional regulator [Prauserella marina]|uniref:DNA-binding transcriptional regulator, LysR family n=1 Tax=Prauserella marina TaxID=530584 RepID=A0A222VJT8_9PSEU|nr:LysR family transcriptional regulator [Prauserella marina]ASR34189.1 LysR family transcriptional regulator [Prauserella marina]PWV70865.1 DNA-binding transcriptional LysR family regulator [Prauserella marina]SDE02138.1 DNA-binding transcriptional regulator, LysR family [Prauserella marina]